MSKNSYKYCHTAHGDILNGQLTVQNPKKGCKTEESLITEISVMFHFTLTCSLSTGLPRVLDHLPDCEARESGHAFCHLRAEILIRSHSRIRRRSDRNGLEPLSKRARTEQEGVSNLTPP